MNRAMVVIGSLMLICGFGLALAAYPTVQDYQTTGGQIVRALDEEAQQEYESAVMVLRLGSCLGMIGLVLLIIGIAIKSSSQRDHPSPIVYQYPPPPTVYSPPQMVSPPPTEKSYQPYQEYTPSMPPLVSQPQPYNKEFRKKY